MISHGDTGISAPWHEISIGADVLRYLMTCDGSTFADAAGDLTPDRWLVVTSAHQPARSMAARVGALLQRSALPTILEVDDTEAAKSLSALHALCERITAAGASRRSCIVGVGGGIVCNLAGLAASVLFRGIRLVQVPTTLLAMSDAVISLKQAVNLGRLKNGFGTYYAPDMVWANVSLLRTMPTHGIRAGLAESIKNALAFVPEQLEVFAGLLRSDAQYEPEELEVVVQLALEAKSQVLADDPKERGSALVLEYGHTTAHALEYLTGGRVNHGIGVGLGMRVAARISATLGMLDGDAVTLHDAMLEQAGLPFRLRPEEVRTFTVPELRRQLAVDNKRGYIPTRPDETAMVLLEKIGVVSPLPLPVRAVPIDTIVEAVRDVVC